MIFLLLHNALFQRLAQSVPRPSCDTRFLWNIEDDLLILYGAWLLFMFARAALLGDRAERCYAKGFDGEETD